MKKNLPFPFLFIVQGQEINSPVLIFFPDSVKDIETRRFCGTSNSFSYFLLAIIQSYLLANKLQTNKFIKPIKKNNFIKIFLQAVCHT